MSSGRDLVARGKRPGARGEPGGAAVAGRRAPARAPAAARPPPGGPRLCAGGRHGRLLLHGLHGGQPSCLAGFFAAAAAAGAVRRGGGRGCGGRVVRREGVIVCVSLGDKFPKHNNNQKIPTLLNT